MAIPRHSGGVPLGDGDGVAAGEREPLAAADLEAEVVLVPLP